MHEKVGETQQKACLSATYTYLSKTGPDMPRLCLLLGLQAKRLGSWAGGEKEEGSLYELFFRSERPKKEERKKNASPGIAGEGSGFLCVEKTPRMPLADVGLVGSRRMICRKVGLCQGLARALAR